MVDLTNKGQGLSDALTRFQIGYNLIPDVTVFREKIKVSNTVETLLGPRERHTCAVHTLDEADFLGFVAAHERKKNDVVFFTLKVVNCRQSDTSQRFRVFLSEAVFNGKHLTHVGCQKCYLMGSVALL